MKRFAQNLKVALKAYAKATSQSSGIAKANIAQKSGRTITAIYNYLKGAAVPTLKAIEVIAASLGFHARNLLQPTEIFREELAEADFSPVPEEDVALILKTNLNRLCRANGETISAAADAIAEKTGLVSGTIKGILNGSQPPSLETLETICKALSVEPYELLTPTNETLEIAKYDALRIEGAPQVSICGENVSFQISLKKEIAGKLIDRAQEEETTPNAVIHDVLEDYL